MRCPSPRQFLPRSRHRRHNLTCVRQIPGLRSTYSVSTDLLKPALQVGTFVRDPEGRYLAGRCWISFCVDGSVAGCLIWGAPTVTDARALCAAMPFDRSALALHRNRLIDIRRLESLDAAAFDVFAHHMIRAAHCLGRIADCVALVQDSPIGLTLVRGLASVVDAPSAIDVRAFEQPAEALAWAGHRASVELAAELELLQARTLGTVPAVRDLRAWLSTELHDAKLPMAAAALGMSSRSLQRRLRDARTSFQDEVDLARIDVAKRLLLDTEAAISSIAQQVGYASPQHFTEVFRKIVAITPLHWRKRERARRDRKTTDR
jgi:AraC-like DNA-binding protein